jgi:hypothetical protein
MHPHYYLMKSKKILRLESEINFSSLPHEIQTRILNPEDQTRMDQEQANWRVVIFRDEIMELDEYLEWLNSPESLLEESYEYDLIAN